MDGGDPGGGSTELALCLDRWGEVLVPDLKHYYGIDLRDLFSEEHPISPRWVLTHIRHLPIGSAFVAEQRGGQQYRDWDELRYQIASLINAVRAQTYVFTLAHSDPKKRTPEPPEPYPVPDDRNKKKQKQDKPGSFAFIAKSHLAALKKMKESEGG